MRFRNKILFLFLVIATSLSFIVVNAQSAIYIKSATDLKAITSDTIWVKSADKVISRAISGLSIKGSSKTTTIDSTVENSSNIGTVTASTLNVRKGPGTSYDTLGALKLNDKVEIISLESGWYKIKFNSNTGYVHSSYIKTDFKENEPAVEKQLGYVTASNLNIRSGPGTNYGVTTTIYKNEEVTILEKQDNWLKVQYSSVIGWASATYITSTKPIDNTNINTNKTIVIDAGHGGFDAGAVGPTGVKEKDVTLSVSLKLGKILQNKGFKVVYTRTKDNESWLTNTTVGEELKNRVDTTKNTNADYFISIHNNSSNISSARGMETYYQSSSNSSQALASDIQDNMVKSLGLPNRGVKTANYYVLRNNSATSVLVELAFISNPNEEKLLNNRTYQDKWANSIANGFISYIASH